MLTIFYAENHIQKFTIHSTQVNTFHVISSWLLTSPSEQRSKAGCSLLPWRYQKSPENRNNEKSSEIKSFTFELLQKYDKSRDSLSNSGSRTPINSTRLSNLFWTANHHFWKHWLLPGDSASWWLDITDSSKIRSRSISSWMLESSSCWGALRGCDWCICWYRMRKTIKNSADEMMQDRTIIPVVPKSKALIHWCSWRITAANPKFQKAFPISQTAPGWTDEKMCSWSPGSLGEPSDFNPILVGLWRALPQQPKSLSIPKLWCWILFQNPLLPLILRGIRQFWMAINVPFEPKPDTLQQLPNPVLAEFHLQFQQSHRLADHGCLIPCLPMVDADKLLGMRTHQPIS